MLIIPTLYLRQQRVASPAPEAHAGIPDDPLQFAAQLRAAGTEMVHVVDLDAGVVAGHSPNEAIIGTLIKDFDLHCQLSGPIRAPESVKHYLAVGVARIILGTLAYQQPQFLAEIVQLCPGRVGVEINVHNHRVVIKGWTVATRKSAADYAEHFRDAGVTCILYSDTSAAGTVTTENLQQIRDFAIAAQLPVIHNTDLASIDQLDQLIHLEKFGVMGTILGKSLYEGRFDLPSLITLTKEHEQQLGADESTVIPE